MTKKEKDIINRIEDLILEGELSNDFLVQNIILSGSYLNLMTISDYAKRYNMQYSAAKKPYNGRRIEKFFNVNFIIDNEKGL